MLACCLPYPGDPKSAIDCFFLFGISLHPGVTGSVPHWKFRGCRVHSFPSPQELLRPASWLALLSRTFTFELAPTRSPSISVEYDYVDKQSIPTAGLSPASPTALWAAGHRISPRGFRRHNEGGLFAQSVIGYVEVTQVGPDCGSPTLSMSDPIQSKWRALFFRGVVRRSDGGQPPSPSRVRENPDCLTTANSFTRRDRAGVGDPSHSPGLCTRMNSSHKS